MARKRKTAGAKRSNKRKPSLAERLRRLSRWFLKALGVLFVVQIFLVALFSVVNPPTDYYMLAETNRLGSIRQEWVPIERISPHMARAVVAAEDANFCRHWGLDMGAIRKVIDQGGKRLRGASTISQQLAKNLFLWPGRSWLRKALEAETTLLIEAFWTKRRILEVYLNIVEFDEGVFGVQAASKRYFGIDAADLSLSQAARLAVVLPDPKRRSAAHPTARLRKHAAAVMDGARTIAADGRDLCFRELKNN